MSFQGHIENGVVVFDEPVPLPAGTVVCVEPAPSPSKCRTWGNQLLIRIGPTPFSKWRTPGKR